MEVEIARSGEVARVGAERFLSGALAQAALLQVAEEVFAQVFDGAAEPAADGGFVDVEGTGDLGEGALIQVIGGEQKTVFRALPGQAIPDGRSEQGQIFRLWNWLRCGCERVIGRRVAIGFRQRLFAPGLAVVVDVALGERGAQPTEQRSAALVGVERRAALAIAQVEAIELGVERVGEFAAKGVAAGDGDGGAGEGLAIERKKALPGVFVAQGAGAGEGQIGEPEVA